MPGSYNKDWFHFKIIVIKEYFDGCKANAYYLIIYNIVVLVNINNDIQLLCKKPVYSHEIRK